MGIQGRKSLFFVFVVALIASGCLPKTGKHYKNQTFGSGASDEDTIGTFATLGVKQDSFADIHPNENVPASRDITYGEVFGFSFNVAATVNLPNGKYKAWLEVAKPDSSLIIGCSSASLNFTTFVRGFQQGLGCTSLPPAPTGCNTYTGTLVLRQDIGTQPGAQFARSDDFAFQICNKVRSASLTLSPVADVASGAMTFQVPYKVTNTGTADLRSVTVSGDSCFPVSIGNLAKTASSSGNIACQNPYSGNPQPIVRSAGYTIEVSDTLGSVAQAQSGSAKILGGTAINANSKSPRGFLDNVDNITHLAAGWAVDDDVPLNPIRVDFYIDAPAGGGGLFIGNTMADKARDLSSVGVQGNHGWTFSIPQNFPGGGPIPNGSHKLFAYGIDAGSNPVTSLANSGNFFIQTSGNPAQMETCSISTNLGNSSSQVVVGDVGACQSSFNSFWTNLCKTNTNSTFNYSLFLASKGNVGTGTNFCINGNPSATPPANGESCTITTTLGNTSKTVSTGDVGACQSAFNSYWTQLCSANANATFSYNLNLTSKGNVGSGVDYCINGQPSAQPPAQNESCSITTSLGSTTTSVGKGDVGACQSAFNNFWGGTVCPANPNSQFTFSLTMPSKGNVGSGTNYCINGQASATPPPPAAQTESCQITTSLGSTSVTIPKTDLGACQNAFNGFWGNTVCPANPNSTFTFSLFMASRGGSAGNAGSGTDYCINGQASATPPPTPPQMDTCSISTSLGNTSTQVAKGDVGACQSAFNNFWGGNICPNNPNSTFSYGLSMTSKGNVGSGTLYCINGQASGTPPPQPPQTETCSINTSLGSTTKTVNKGDVGACQDGFNQFWGGSVCPNNPNATFTFNLSMPSKGGVGSGTNYCINGNPSGTPPPQPPATEQCQINTSLGSTSKTINKGDLGACQNEFNNFWGGSICPNNPNATFSYGLHMDSRGGGNSAGSGTLYCVNGQASGSPPPPPPMVETCYINTSAGNFENEISKGDLGACQNAFNGRWGEICNSNPDIGFSYSLYMPSRGGGGGNAGSGFLYCIGGNPSGTPP